MNFYKITKFFLFSAILGMGAVACTDLEVVELDSEIIESEGGQFSNDDPLGLLASAYTDLGAFTDQANIYSLFTHTSDEMIPPTRGVDWGDNGVWRTLHAHSWDPTHSFVLGAWNQLNSRAFKCNQILASNNLTPEIIAEAKFLRGFYTWHIMDLYGQVPVRGVNEGVDVDPTVFSRSEAFDIVRTDLEESLPDLSNTGPSATNSAATQAAANAMLARLLLNRGVYTAASPEGPYTFDAADMNRVIEHCNAVTDAGYSLESEFFTNFSTEATSEVIFTSAEGSPQNRYFMTLHYSQNPSGWNGFTTLADFYDTFEAQDQRIGNYPPPDGSEFSGIGRGFLIGQQFNDDGSETIDSRTNLPLNFTPDVPLAGAATEKGIRAIKYHPANQGQYILLRYADVLLMKAEAIMRGGTDPNGQSALDVVNELRAVRGASALSSIDEVGMLDERGREMYWEGTRRIDQIRFSDFASKWAEKDNVETFRVLFPIPQQALDSNPNLQQNAGY